MTDSKRPRKFAKKASKKEESTETLPETSETAAEDVLPRKADTLSNSGLTKILRDSLGGSIFLRDRDFGFVSEAQMVATGNLIQKTLRRKGIKYGPRFDCDDFTIKYLSELSLVYAMRESAVEGFAAGFLFYTDQELGPHARIWYVTEDQDLKFFEAIEGKPAELSETERQSAWFVFG